MQAMAKMVEQLPVRHPTMSAHAGNGTDSDEFGGSADVATVVKVAGTPPATETSDPYAREVAIGATETSQIKNSTVVDDRQSFTANYPSSKKAMFPEYECELGGNGVRKPPFNDDDDLAARRELMDTGNWRPTLFGTNDVRMRSPHQSLKPAGRHEVDAESDRDYDGELDMDVESGLARHVVVSTSKIPIVPDSFKRLQTRKNAQVQERIVGDALFTAESEDMHSEDGSSSSADDDEDRRQQSGYSSGNDDSYECQLDLRIAGHQRQQQYNDVTIDEETSASLKRSIKPPKSCFSIVNILRPEFGAIPAGSKSPSPPPNASVPSHKAKTAPAHASALRRAHQQAMTAASRKLQPKTTPMPRSSPPEIASSNASNDGGIEMRNQLLLQSKQMMQQFQQQQEIMYHLQNQQQQQPIMIQGTPFSAAVNGAASTAILDQRQLPVGFNPYATFYAAAAIAAAMAVATGASPANTAPGVQALAGANAMAPRQIVPLPVHHTAQLPEQIKTGNAFCVGNDIDNNNVMAAVVKKFDCCSSGTAGGHPRGEKTRSDVISDDELVCYSNESAKMATISPRYKTSATIEQSHRKFRPSAKVSTATSITSGGPPHQTDKKRSANVTSSDARKTTTTSGPESNHRSTPTAAAGDKANLPPLPWPAWVYCTRYSDRPSSGPRSRKPKKKDTGAHGSVHGDEKRPRTAFTAGQLERLKREFDDSKYLTEERRQSLARELSLNESQIKIWFQNKRAKMKKASGVRNQLALQLMAQGLYNHSSGSGSSQSSTSSKSSGQLPGGQKQPNSGLSPNVVQRTAEWAILAN